MDPNNPVIQLCLAGMQAEGRGRPADALDLFTQAWHAAADDYEACIAAHYLARHQPTPADTLHWNREALRRAGLAGDERVQDFYPSLYLNLAHSYEQLGDLPAARRLYTQAAQAVEALPDDRYGGIVREGIQAGLRRVRE